MSDAQIVFLTILGAFLFAAMAYAFYDWTGGCIEQIGARARDRGDE